MKLRHIRTDLRPTRSKTLSQEKRSGNRFNIQGGREIMCQQKLGDSRPNLEIPILILSCFQIRSFFSQLK